LINIKTPTQLQIFYGTLLPKICKQPWPSNSTLVTSDTKNIFFETMKEISGSLLDHLVCLYLYVCLLYRFESSFIQIKQ